MTRATAGIEQAKVTFRFQPKGNVMAITKLSIHRNENSS
jgi:hypothetical protein